ncbi:MAG: hypothetical protein WBL61_25805 [Bryobacteraceae bacterium]
MVQIAKHEIFREPFEGDNGYYTYTWNESNLFQMQWNYTVEWPASGKPTIWIHSYRCWQVPTLEAPLAEVEHLPFDIPMSDSILYRLTQHAARQLYSRSVVVGPMKLVPEDFLDRAEEAAGKRYDARLIREMSQREAARTTAKHNAEAGKDNESGHTL